MKTTLEMPDSVFRKAKAKAAERGIPFRQFVTEAVEFVTEVTGDVSRLSSSLGPDFVAMSVI